MSKISVDFSKLNGKIKPMNAVNNGPTAPGVRNSFSNFEDYKALGVPYARNHDASFFTGYGGEHTVDVHRIFKNFDADENDPKSYIFEPTDKYLTNIKEAGTKVFYRLGASIEHGYKFGTYPPKDNLKWARICEHIINHYINGWADGFYYDIEYWEIWNEPDCYNADGSNPCWQGTNKEFCELYCVASKYLKSKFPKLKIGGPAFCAVSSGKKLIADFLEAVRKSKAPLDFFSYHWYGSSPKLVGEKIKVARDFLDEYGFSDTETVLNEWNYVKGWRGDEWKYTLKAEKNLKGASFILGTMCMGQANPVDMLMYYDFRPCAMNGVFKNETYEPLKGYYSFKAFGELAKLGLSVDVVPVSDDVYCCAAANGNEGAVILTYFDNLEATEYKEIELDIKLKSQNIRLQIFCLDVDKDLELVSEAQYGESDLKLMLKIGLFSSLLIKFKPFEANSE